MAVIAGFQGIDDQGNITTLGRGGSDTSAVAVAAALGADVAYDVDRTYKMEAMGLRVRWRDIPDAITPMNRVLIGVPRTASEKQAAAGTGA